MVQGSQERGARSVSGSCSSSSPGAGEAGTGRPPSARSTGENTPGLRSKTSSASAAATASESSSIGSQPVGAGSGVASAGEGACGQALLLRYGAYARTRPFDVASAHEPGPAPDGRHGPEGAKARLRPLRSPLLGPVPARLRHRPDLPELRIPIIHDRPGAQLAERTQVPPQGSGDVLGGEVGIAVRAPGSLLHQLVDD